MGKDQQVIKVFLKNMGIEWWPAAEAKTAALSDFPG